jgi:hypothetical protein
MSYCFLTDVNTINVQRTYNGNDKPTGTQVNTMIVDIAALMDARLNAIGFTVPITNAPISLALLKIINALGAAAMAEEAIYEGSATTDVRPKYVDLWKRYEAEMKRIEVNRLLLSDATWTEVTSTYPTPGNLTSYHQENPSADGLEPRFEMGEKW